MVGIIVVSTLGRYGAFEAGLDMGMVVGGFWITVAIVCSFFLSVVIATLFHVRSRDNKKP